MTSLVDQAQLAADPAECEANIIKNICASDKPQCEPEEQQQQQQQRQQQKPTSCPTNVVCMGETSSLTHPANFNELRSYDNDPRPIVQIDFITDIICNWCYISKRVLDQAIAATMHLYRFQVAYRPFLLSRQIPPEGVPISSLPPQLSALFFDPASPMHKAANAVGLTLCVDPSKRRFVNSMDAHRLVVRAGGSCSPATAAAAVAEMKAAGCDTTAFVPTPAVFPDGKPPQPVLPPIPPSAGFGGNGSANNGASPSISSTSSSASSSEQPFPAYQQSNQLNLADYLMHALCVEGINVADRDFLAATGEKFGLGSAATLRKFFDNTACFTQCIIERDREVREKYQIRGVPFFVIGAPVDNAAAAAAAAAGLPAKPPCRIGLSGGDVTVEMFINAFRTIAKCQAQSNIL